jgi:two-component sensor histidine kinase
MWPERFRILPVRTAIALLTACFLLAFGIPVLVAFVSSPELTDVVDRSALVWVAAANLLFSVGTAWFVATVFILARARRLTEEHLINVNEQLELSIARMRQEIWFTQQNLAWVLHGPVQSALTSATIRLESGAVRDAADRAAIWSSLKKAFELLTTAGPGVPNFNDFATELTDLWQGVCTISFIDSNKTMDCVAADPAATYAVIEVVRESVGNAIRHGDATTVDITINEQTEGLLDLVITDNGSGLSKDATPGIGSDLFDSLAYSWSRDSSGSSTTITAVLTWTPAL